jgi:hypothetical protein
MLHQQVWNADADVDVESPPSQPPLVYLDWQKRLDRELDRHFSAEVLATFSPGQLAVFETLRRRAPTKHKFEYRVSIPLPWKAYYVTIFAGPERRSADRLAHEGQMSLTRRASLITAVMMVMASSAVLSGFCALYLAKSALGIDLMEGPSPLHFLYQMFIEN